MAGLGPTVWQVEQNKFAQCVLRHHWPESELFDDVRTVGAAQLAHVELICGGFPCQDVSSAGTRAGLAGSRSGLWREFARVVGEMRPAWVVVENVTSGASQWLDAIVRELDALGYDCLPCPVSARDVGAPHRRERLFVVAHAHGERELQPQGSVAELRGRVADGVTADAHSDGLRVEPGRRESRGEAPISSATGTPRGASDIVAERRQGPGRQLLGREPSARPWGPPKSDLVPLVHGLRGGMAGRRRRARIRALGNAVVPQCAEVVGWVIRELAGATLDARKVAAE
jgi:DNA (cytosine-5)-methyltransferase 1